MTVKFDLQESFIKLKKSLMNIDPVMFCEEYLTLDGNPFRLTNNGYKPFSDIYRYIGIKGLERSAKPVILVKGRQVGGTTMAAALELYFMCSGLFGTKEKPPIRVMHVFPTLQHSKPYSKTKLNAMIAGAKPSNTNDKKGKPKSVIQELIDTSSESNNSLEFKQFLGGNHLWIESTGLEGDRLRGRQLCLETELLTPNNGFVKLKHLKKGDQLFDEKGNVCNITKLHPINYTPEAYKIIFDDGSTVDACSDHKWLTYTKKNRIQKRKYLNKKSKFKESPTVKTTKEIFETLKTKDGKESNHSIPCSDPISYNKKDLILDPYLFGVWLGDGDKCGRIETADPEILYNYEHNIIPSSINKISPFSNNQSQSSSYRVQGLTTKLRKLGVAINNHKGENDYYKKYIPNDYMTASFDQRLSLLQGLMDSDGCCYKDHRCEFTQVDDDLSNQVYDLILSLGIKARKCKKISLRYGKKYKDKNIITFITKIPVFRLKRKLQRLKTSNYGICKNTHRFIVDVKPINSKPMRCLTVDSPSHLFLITRNLIPTHNTADVMFLDEFQDTNPMAVSNILKCLSQAKYGSIGEGVQIYFGTPKAKGSNYYKMWNMSTRQLYYLGCENCKEHFPLYTPDSDEWEKIWLYEYIVKCTNCGHEQDKREAAERGKWIMPEGINPDNCKFVGFHINQLYIPSFTKEYILSQKPENDPNKTDREYRNEVMGEFFQGDSSTITREEILEFCGDVGRKFRGRVMPGDEQMMILGIDYGARSDAEQLAKPDMAISGKSFSTAVVLSAKGPNLLHVEFAKKFHRNDFESKKGLIDQIMRQYSINVAIGDIGFSHDLSHSLHVAHGDRYLVSRAMPSNVKNNIKFLEDSFPKELQFDRNYYIEEIFDMMRKGQIRFPLGDYEKVAWLIDHCSSMSVKVSLSETGEHKIKYVKGNKANDGLMALLNGYLGYKYLLTNKFTIQNPFVQEQNFTSKDKPLIIGGYMSF